MIKHKYGVTKSGDPNTKTGKYIVFCTEANPFHPTDKPGRFSMYLDERSVEGGFYWNAAVIHKPIPPDMVPGKPHYHDYIEYVVLYGTNPDDPFDLGGEVEFWLGDEKHVVTNTFVITIPADLSHCPFIFKRVDRPILFSSCSPAPVLIFLCANPGDDDIHEGREYYLFDAGLAFENLLLAATDLGLITHPMSSVNEDKLKEVLNIPDEVRFIAATPLSYPSLDSYDEAARDKLSQRTRKDLKEVTYYNEWGKSL